MMYTKGLGIAVLALFLVPATLPLWYDAAAGRARTAPPALELPAGKKACIEATDYMSRYHRELLARWQESVVREGRRTYVAADGKSYTMSLTKTCLGCHTDKAHFCDRCHTYLKVEPTCWRCHVVPPKEGT